MEIGKKLKEARINSGLTQEQVAEDIKSYEADNLKLGEMKDRIRIS